MRPLAYHITWGTYGTRLHGGPRKTVDRKQNQHGTPVLDFDADRWEQVKELLKHSSIIFTRPQMLFIEATVPLICQRGYWTYHTCAAGPDHVHV